MAEHAAYLWWNGEMKPWSDARVHVTTLGWSTMSAVFEGIKAYWNDQQQELYALQLREHYQNSRLALVEAVRHGYDLPILLNDQQKITEGHRSRVSLRFVA